MSLHMTKFGQGTPLVLFHGWGFDGRVWDSLVLALSESRYQLFVVDLPGFGLTPDMSWDEFKVSLLNQLPETFAIIGWSMGGLWATRLCIEAGERVTQLMNIASSPCFIKKEDWIGVEETIFEAFYQQLIISPKSVLEEFIRIQLQGLPIAEDVSSYVVPAQAGIHSSGYIDVDMSMDPRLREDDNVTDSVVTGSTTSGAASCHRGLCAGLDVLLNWDLRSQLIKLKMPVFYLFGRRDAIVPRNLILTMQKQFPHFNYALFKEAGHVPFLSHQADFIDILDAWIL